jgi:cyclopropane fatty-acyl-phospholipid synthase-like methyltransferase
VEYNETYRNTENYFGTEPEPLLKDHTHLLDKSHRILDLGVGQGRHSLFLARQGFQVDAIDPSKVAIEKVSAMAAQEGLSIRVYRSGYQTFVPQTDFYSGILIFGLIQILPWEAIEVLLRKVKVWTRVGSLVFVRAFTTSDRSFAHAVRSQEWKSIGRNSFTDGHGKFRTYLESAEILDLFGDYKPIYHWEGLGPKHRHADGPMERHAEVEGLFQR